MCQLWSGMNLYSVSFSSANSKSHLNVTYTEATLYSEGMKTGLITLCAFLPHYKAGSRIGIQKCKGFA